MAKHADPDLQIETSKRTADGERRSVVRVGWRTVAILAILVSLLAGVGDDVINLAKTIPIGLLRMI